MMDPLQGGKVFGLEFLAPLHQQSIENIQKNNKHLLESGRITMKQGDGWAGLASEAPFDAIHVGAAAEEVPKALLSQLKEGGRMIIPVGTRDQELLQIDKSADGSVKQTKLIDVMYVPLVRSKSV
jgi:protein-L-isoaspartate(D-aspartate) O-methyltransferase